MKWSKVKEKVRGYIRTTDQYKREHQLTDEPEQKHTVEYRADGTVTYDRIIGITEGETITPESIMKAHNIDPKQWVVVSYKNNYWHSQVKGGKRLLLYQSKIVVRPLKDNEISSADIKEWFTNFEKTYTPTKVNYIKQDAKQLLETNIADLHFGKLAWHGDCGEDYDWKIASERFNYIIDDIISRVDKNRIERILFPVGNDFFNSDTVMNTTTKGTQQTNDLRWQKMFKSGLGLLVGGIDKLKKIAPVTAFYVPANHDEMVSFYCSCVLESHFNKDSDVIIDTNSTPRKYHEYYNTLIGFSHGDADKPRIQKLMQIEAREAWGRTQFHEMHTAHLHSEQVKEDGGLIWRVTSSVTGADTWHSQSGFVGAVKKSQSFVYDREKGLINIINSVI